MKTSLTTLTTAMAFASVAIAGTAFAAPVQSQASLQNDPLPLEGGSSVARNPIDWFRAEDVTLVRDGNRWTWIVHIRRLTRGGSHAVVIVPEAVAASLTYGRGNPIATPSLTSAPGGFLEPGDQLALTATIAGFAPTVAGVGGQILLQGDKFSPLDANICAVVRQGGLGGPVVGFSTPAVGGASKTEVVLDLNGVADGATTGIIVYEEGIGSREKPADGVDYSVLDAWVWKSTGNEASEATTSIALTPSPAPTPTPVDVGVLELNERIAGAGGGGGGGGGICENYSGYVVGTPGTTRIEIVLPAVGACAKNSEIYFQVDASTTSGSLGFDESITVQSKAVWSTATCCLRICQAFEDAYLQAFGVVDLACTTQVNGNGDCVISVLPPFGTDWTSGSSMYISVCF